MTSTPPPSSETSTRERILAAAIEEFAQVGFAGARVDAIARRAGCNKQLLYHYFRDKEGLHRAVVETVLTENEPEIGGTFEEIIQGALEHFELLAKDRRWVRMMQWEALEAGGRPLVADAERRCRAAEKVENVRELQAAGRIRRDVEPEILLLQIASLMLAPWLLPQFAEFVAGTRPDDPDFRARYTEALRGTLVRLLAADPR